MFDVIEFALLIVGEFGGIDFGLIVCGCGFGLIALG